MKIKSFTKILSGILCAALTMQIGWGLKTEKINAYHGNISSVDTVNGSVVSLSTSDDTYTSFHFSTDNDGGINITYQSDDAGNTDTIHFDKIYDLRLEGPACQINIDSDISIYRIIISDGAYISIAENCTLSTSELASSSHTQIMVATGATLECEYIFYEDETERLIFTNNGSIVFDSMYIVDSADFSKIEYYIAADATIKVTSDLFIGSFTGEGTFITEPSTSISSNGSSFNLQVGEAKKVITGSFSNKTPETLFDDPFSFGTVSDVYYGQSYDFSDLISVTDGYNESVYLEYSSDGVNYSTTKPTAQSPNNYYVRAVAPDSGTYLGKTTSPQTYKINFLDFDDLFEDGSKTYDSVSGIVNGKYVAGDLVLKMPDGILIKGYSFDSGDFANTITLTPDDVLIDGRVNQDSLIQLRRASDNATTNGNIALVDVYPEITNLEYDLYDPYVDVQFVDGREMSIEDGMLTGDKVVIGISDENLDKIYINGELYDYEAIEEGYVELELNSTVGKATEYSIKATDLAGRSTTLDFTLFPNTADADLSVSVTGTIYAGDNYSVDVKTNSDGEVTLQYKDASTNTVLSSKPTTAGKYTVTATAEETDFYFEVSNSTSYTIIKRTPDTTLSVPSVVYVGDDYDVESTTDSDGNVIYQYYDKNNDSYLSSKPSSVGEYTVTARTTETSKYYSSEDSASFKIIKRDPTISLSVPDTTIGQTYSPELVTNSNSNSITYEYKVKDAADSTYSKTKPTAAGSYTIRVTIGSTDKFNGASATDDFTISKKTPSVTLGVGTPYAGTTYKPSFTSNSDAADRAVFEYKEKNADDSKYSTTLPTAYGEYVVRVTIPETAEFAKTIVTADYRIIYLAAPQTAYVIEGQSGKNNYFISDVVLKAPTGYTISAVYGGPYTASIPYKDGITSVYLKRTSDNALTTAIPITNAPRVDKNAPSISAQTGAITPGAVMYASDFTLNVSDPNLRSLKVNGEAIDLTNNKDGYTLTLNPGYGSQTYKIMAEDEAGNVTTIEFTLKAEWLKDKVIIPDVVLPLEGNESYNLGDGYWLVTRNTPEGPVTDNTVYSGNMPFYVNEGGDYTFTKVI